MKFTLLNILLLSFLIFGCEQFSRKSEVKKNKQIFTAFIEEAVKSGDPLPGSADTTYKLSEDYNQLLIDTITVNDENFYTLLVEYSNPVKNRFAVYDTSYLPVLIDRSLNGKLTFTPFKKDGINFIIIDEAFISKNILTINRISIYRIEKDTAYPALKTLTYLKKPDIEYFQKVTTLTKDSIVTELSATKKSVINGEKDIFYFDEDGQRYIGQKNIFDNLMQEHIDYERTPEENEITDEESAEKYSAIFYE